MNNRAITTIALVPLVLLAMGVKGLKVPRGHRNDPPKTAQDQAGQQNQSAPPQQQPPAATRPAGSQLAKAQAALEQVERKLWAGFEKGDDYVKAMGALKAAQDGYDAAYKGVVTKLGDRAEYAAAVGKEKEAEEALKSGQGDVAGLAAAAMDARKAVHKMEADAAGQDEGAKEARVKVAEAKGVVDGLRKGFGEMIKEDPEYVAAKKAVEDARGAVGKKA